MNFDWNLIQENIWFIYIGFIWVLFMYFLVSSYRKRGRLKVRVKTPLGEKTRWVKPEADGKTVVMQKATSKEMGWSFTFTNQSLIPHKHWWGGFYYALDVFHDALKAIDYDYTLSEADQPQLTKKEAAEINRLDGFKRRMGKPERPISLTIQWIIVFLLIGLLILTILNMRGVRVF